jgi:hypothetical protein
MCKLKVPQFPFEKNVILYIIFKIAALDIFLTEKLQC